MISESIDGVVPLLCPPRDHRLVSGSNSVRRDYWELRLRELQFARVPRIIIEKVEAVIERLKRETK